jgi:hypothetical protein
LGRYESWFTESRHCASATTAEPQDPDEKQAWATKEVQKRIRDQGALIGLAIGIMLSKV